MITEKSNQTIQLKNGRFLAYTEYGDPMGKPVIYCHGSPGSRLDMAPNEEIIHKANVRLIAPDRPGIGLSDFQAGYQLLDWPNMVIELADALGLDRFAVLGLSGGGPFSAACAFKIVERVTRAAIVSGVGFIDTPGASDAMSQTNKLGFQLARRAKWLLRLQYWLMSFGLKSDPARVLKQMKQSLPEPDRAILEENQDDGMALIDSMAESLRAGTQGIAHEWSLFVRPWGFRLDAISTDVQLWHGEADTSAPVVMGRQIAEAIPHCKVHFIAGEGHVSLFSNHMPEILVNLVR